MKKTLIVLSIITVLFLVGCNSKEKIENINSSLNNETYQQQEIIDNNQNVTGEAISEYEVADFVYDAKYEKNVQSNSYETEFGNIYNVEDIVVPYINIDSDYAIKANSEIKQIFNSAIGKFNEGINDKLTYVDECKYEAYINDGKLSVVLVYGVGATDVVYPEYYIYNFNLENGNKISYEEAFTYAGFNSTNIAENIEIAIRNKLQESLGEVFTSEDIDTYTKLSVQNYNDSLSTNTIKYFIDEKGIFNVVVKLAIPAGKGEEDTIIRVFSSRN